MQRGFERAKKAFKTTSMRLRNNLVVRPFSTGASHASHRTNRSRFIFAMRKSAFPPLQLPHVTKAPEILNPHHQRSNCSAAVMRLPKAWGFPPALGRCGRRTLHTA
jgi:hypothetical protein